MIVGTCSICGGPVEGSDIGEKRCCRCGAAERINYGPVIPMVPRETFPPCEYPLPLPILPRIWL